MGLLLCTLLGCLLRFAAAKPPWCSCTPPSSALHLHVSSLIRLLRSAAAELPCCLCTTSAAVNADGGLSAHGSGPIGLVLRDSAQYTGASSCMLGAESPCYLQERIFGASSRDFTASVTDPSDSEFESAQWTTYNQLATGDSDLDWGFVVSCCIASSGMTQHR